MTSVLYISYTGLLDPLGQSQVLQYVLALGRNGHRITVLSFEKPDALNDSKRVAAMRTLCEEGGVDWRPRLWHNRPIGLVATLYDLLVGSFQSIRIAREVRAEIVHCRSYIASLMGLAVKRVTGAKFLFDMRGFWPDERVDGGIWSQSSMTYFVFKRVERSLFLSADHVVCLTKAGVREYEAFDYMRDERPKSTVIPTCTNLDMFRPQKTLGEGFTLGYVGSVGSWYMFDEVALAVSRLFKMRPDARFLVLNKGGHQLIRKELHAAGVDMSRVELREASFAEVAAQIARMDAGIFFIKPAWSKRASCPTRMGEFLACGKPCLANDGVGDVEEDFRQTGTGVTLPVTSDGRLVTSGLDAALEALMAMASGPDMSVCCRAAAEERFSLDGGVEKYDRIYARLTKNGS
jgi:glycosyltransferase involved in cell wall biosynthesis